MKTKDRVKEEIGLEKLLMTLLVAVVSSLLSWTWSNNDILLKEFAYFLYSLSAIGVIISFIIFIKIKLKIREIDSYE